MRLLPALLVIVASTVPRLASGQAYAGAVAIPPGGGLDGVDIELDADAAVLRTRACKTVDCVGATFHETPIPIAASRIQRPQIRLEPIPIGEGRQVVRVRVPDAGRPDLAFEALVSGHASAPLFAGLTGYTTGTEGDRAGQSVLVYDRDATSKFVLVADVREDTRICGQPVTPLAPRGLDPRTMQFRSATLHRLDKAARDQATRIVATARGSGPRALARLLVATGGSQGSPAALTDGDPQTRWTEQKPGDGHGEFVTMRAPAELPIVGLVVEVAAKGPLAAHGAAPRTFHVATDDRIFFVTMPEDAATKPEHAYAITFPEPVRTTCLAVVLDEAYARGDAAPEVGFGEITALSRFDVDSNALDDVARALPSARGNEAAALLRRAGEPGLAAVAAAYPSLDERGRALAVDVATSVGTCDGTAMTIVTTAIGDRDVEVRRKSIGRIERCGKAAGPALARAVKEGDGPRRAMAASLLATVSPDLAIGPLAEQMGAGTPETRKAVRGAFSRASAGASRAKLLGLVTNRETGTLARLDLLRALGPRLVDLRPEADAAIAELLLATPDMATRYVLAQPLAQLARSPDATTGELSRLADLVRRDPEWPVRARAVELAGGVPALVPTVIAAGADPEPRVREAAFHAIATGRSPTGADSAAHALASDAWPFVRAAAAEALGALARDATTTRALGAAVTDPSVRVRVAAITALGAQRASSQAARITERLDDPAEDVDVRALAARTLGQMCVAGAIDRLTELAARARTPMSPGDDRIGLAAIEALGVLHPADLEKRIAPLLRKDTRLPARRAATQAMEHEGCR